MYRAFIETRPLCPTNPGPVIECRTLRALKTACAAYLWPEIEWPRSIKPGHYFRASCAAGSVEIYKMGRRQ